MHALSLSPPGAAANVCGLILPKSSVAFLLVANSSTPVSSGSNRNSFLGSEKHKDQTLPNAVSGAVPP